jgi:hypothetical protein
MTRIPVALVAPSVPVIRPDRSGVLPWLNRITPTAPAVEAFAS